MTNQIRPSVTNPTIAAIYNEIADDLLLLAPEFQRKFVWTQEHQEQFLETILKGLPFPEIYVSTGAVDIQRMRTTRYVIDGQQRLTTIRNYIVGTFKRPLSLIKSYADLTDAEKSEFLRYEVVLRDLGKVDDETVREIFRRINLTKFKLDTIEIHNAVYDGSFIRAAKKVLDTVQLSVFEVFRESEFTRMADLQFILTVMATIESGGYFSQDSAVESYIERFNEEYPDSDSMVELMRSVFASIVDGKLPEDSMWFRKANFFTLVVEISKAFHRDQKISNEWSQRILELERLVMQNKQNSNNEFGEYYSYMYQNTNGRKARVIRGTLFRKYCDLRD